MNHNLGEVSYDIRFARQKASQDIAAIEAEWNAALARMNSKGVGLSGGGGRMAQATGGYAGATSGNGQPMQGAAPRGPNISPIPSNGDVSWNLRDSMTNPNFRYYGGDRGGPRSTSGGTAPDADLLAYARRARREAELEARGLRRDSAAADAADERVAAMRVGQDTADQVPTGLPSTLTHAKGKKTQLSPMASRALKLIGGVAIAQTITNVMGAVEESLNETLAAGNDPIRQRMAQRNIGRNLAGSVPFIGGGLQNIIDFGSTGAANRRDQLAIMARETGAAYRVMAVGTESTLLRASGIRGSSHVASTFGSFAKENEDVAQLEEKRRQALLSPTARFDGTNRIFNDSINATRKMSQAERARANFDIEREIYDQQQENQRMRFESEMRPIKGAAFQIADTAIDRARMTVGYNNRQRQVGRNAFGEIDPSKPLTNEQIDQNDSIDRANQLERERARGSLQQLNVMRTDVMRNILAGRPQEIGGMQSIEAMRDFSPETNEMKLKALNDAIDRLAQTITNLQKVP